MKNRVYSGQIGKNLGTGHSKL